MYSASSFFFEETFLFLRRAGLCVLFLLYLQTLVIPVKRIHGPDVNVPLRRKGT